MYTIKEGTVVYDSSKKRQRAQGSSQPFLGDPEAAHMLLHALFCSKEWTSGSAKWPVTLTSDRRLKSGE
jgi:hypothetical protein